MSVWASDAVRHHHGRRFGTAGRVLQASSLWRFSLARQVAGLSKCRNQRSGAFNGLCLNDELRNHAIGCKHEAKTGRAEQLDTRPKRQDGLAVPELVADERVDVRIGRKPGGGGLSVRHHQRVEQETRFIFERHIRGDCDAVCRLDRADVGRDEAGTAFCSNRAAGTSSTSRQAGGDLGGQLF